MTSFSCHYNCNDSTLLAPGYIRGSKTRAEAAAASANKNGVSNMTQGYKHDTGLQIGTELQT